MQSRLKWVHLLELGELVWFACISHEYVVFVYQVDVEISLLVWCLIFSMSWSLKSFPIWHGVQGKSITQFQVHQGSGGLSDELKLTFSEDLTDRLSLLLWTSCLHCFKLRSLREVGKQKILTAMLVFEYFRKCEECTIAYSARKLDLNRISAHSKFKFLAHDQ